MRKILVFILFSTIFGTSLVRAKSNSLELVARANDYNGYQLPDNSFLSNITPIINNTGDVVFQFITYENGFLEKGIWFKSSKEAIGNIVFRVTGEQYLSTPSLAENGDFIFNLYTSSVPLGVYKYSFSTGKVHLLIDPEDHPFRQYSNVSLGEEGDIVFRGSSFSGKQSLVKFSKSSAMKKLFKMGNGVSYIFGPSYNKKNKIVSKVRMGELGDWGEDMPDQILSWDLLGNKHVIARDRDSDINSRFLGFFNSVGVSSNGLIVFIARLEDKKNGIFLATKDGKISQVAIEGSNGLLTIEQFAPHVNNQGVVAFRGISVAGKRQIYTITNSQIVGRIGEDSLLDTGTGTGRILFRNGYPGFGGGISLNDKSQVIFNCLLTNTERGLSLGSGVYILR